jgi:hypothetical protein
MIQRTQLETLSKGCAENKILVLRGAKRTGRLELVRQLFDINDDKVCLIDCDDKKQRKQVNSLEQLIECSQHKRVVIIREAQHLNELQAYIDWVFDQDSLSNLVLICSYEPALNEELWEVLRSQNLEIRLFPMSYEECANAHGVVSEDRDFEQRLIYGYYPEIVQQPDHAETLLFDILEHSTLHTLSAFERVNKSEQLIKLLRHLSFNIGKVLSFNDLGKKCGLDNETVERYIQLFEKAQILLLIPSYYSGHRYELKKSYVVYFIDNGIRNALIRAFQPIEFRNDLNELWKNWVISERYKANQYAGRKKNYAFWLTHTKQEIDLLEINEQGVQAYKFQYDHQKVKVPKLFEEIYPNIKVNIINRKSLWNFLRKP